jgi:predicted RNA-binding Zn ribbon-like protein
VPDSYPFPLVGEPLAVDLANTLAIQKGLQVDLLTAATAPSWWAAHEAELGAPPEGGELDVGRLRELRDAVAQLFGAALAGTQPPSAAIDVVNAASASGATFPRLGWSGGEGALLESGARSDAMVTGLGAIAGSAIGLLTGEGADRLRRCEGPDCELLFVATNLRRRWCSPTRCGNRVRGARHYRRHGRANR